MLIVKKYWLHTLIVIVLVLGPVFCLWFSPPFRYCIDHQGQQPTPQHNENGAPVILIPAPSTTQVWTSCIAVFSNDNGAAITALATVLLTVITGGLVWIGINQAQSTQAIERAYVFITMEIVGEVITNDSAKGADNKAKVKMRNAGKTPAILTRLRGMPFNFPPFRYPDSLIGEDGPELPPGLVIPPGETFPISIPFTMTTKVWDEIQRMNVSFGFCGKVEYKDVLHGQRETGFCWHYSPHEAHKTLVPSPSKLNRYT